MNVEIVKHAPIFTKASDLHTGQVGEVCDGEHKGALLLRTYDQFVNLKNPAEVWATSCTLMVIRLIPGTQLLLTVVK